MKQRVTANIIFILISNLLLVVLIVLLHGRASGQYYKDPVTWESLAKNWSVNANFGRTSFYGDVSLYDYEFTEKIRKEGSWAWGIGISREFINVISVHAHFLRGELAGSNSRSHFSSRISEKSIHASMNLLNMLIPDNQARFFPYVKGGMGQLTFRTKLIYNDPNQEDVRTRSESPEFVLLYGGGAYFVINGSFGLNLEYMSRRIGNDKIDGITNNNDYEHFSYLSMGLNYKINNKPHDVRQYRRLGMKSPLIRRH
jgi:opacity protein-like surface antigen